jgi:hypothetical protein
MKKIFILTLLSCLTIISSCKKVLEEDVRSQISDSYFDTAAGWQEGIIAGYNSMRNWYGQQNAAWLTIWGTDEYTYGTAVIQGFDTYNNDINPTSAVILQPWNALYQGINTCNAVIDRADAISLDAKTKSMRLGEARFIRANLYFLLVQTYGDVYLSLHQTAGTSRAATRSSVAAVYQVIIDDLTYAVANLPQTTPDFGRANLPAAKHALAKVYLTRAGGKAAQPGDYTKAAMLAKEVIASAGPKLLDDFGNLFVQGAGEKNDEVLFSVQFSTNAVTNSGGNKLHLLFNCAYPAQSGIVADVANGRFFAHFRPTNYMLNLYNKQVDSRFEKSFRTVWYVNNPGTFPINKDIVPNKTVNMVRGDTAFVIGDREYTAAERNSKRYTLIPPSKLVRNENGGGSYETIFPVNSKFYDALRLNNTSTDGTRDFIVSRLGETYLIAAEALMMDGNPGEAVTYINTLRRRAARTGSTPAITAANKAAMEVAASDLNIDFILDERARELTGEMTRWFDLVRTGKLLERVKKYNVSAAPNIQPYHVLRPIPQDQIDKTDGGAASFPQNAGY